MKIGLVLDDTLDKSDGVQQYVLALGRWLAKRRHEVHYLVAKTERTDVPNVHSLGSFVKVRFNGNLVRTPLPVKKEEITALLAREKFDVLHIQMPYSPVLGKRVIDCAPVSTRIVGTFHILPTNKWHGYTNRLLRRALGSSLKRLDAVVSVSEPAADFARRIYKIDSTVVPNAVEVSRFRTGKPIEAFKDGHLNLLFLGRFVQRKGVVEFVKAAKALPQKDLPPLRFILCGDGPKIYAAKALAKGDERFLFTGFISEETKPDFLASADIAVFPSLYGESFGIVLVEAMAAGAGVVIGGNNPGYQTVLDNKADLLFDPTNTESFVHRLTDLIKSRETRARLHTWQQARVKRYDIDVVGEQLLELYKNTDD